MATNKPRRALGYARVSSVAQTEGTSLGDQQEAIRAYAKTRGLKVERVYVEAESGIREKFEKREQLHALMSDARSGDIVLVHRLDRWSRDPEVTYRTVRQLLERGASFYSVDDGCDPSTPEGDTMLNFRVLFAREEHKRIKARMVGTRRLLRDRGLYSEGLPPFGYARPASGARNVLVVREDEAKLVKRIFAMAIGGKSLMQIAAELKLKRDRVADVLRRRLYLGEIRDSNGMWIRGQHPPIIDAETFQKARDAVDNRYQHNRPSHHGLAETHSWLLRDVAVCANCGRTMSAAYAGPRGSKYRRHYYKCWHRCTPKFVPVKDVEAEFVPMLVGRLAELRELLAQPAHKKSDPRVVDFDEARERLATKRTRTVDMYTEGDISREDMKRRLERIDAEMVRLETRAAAANRPSPLDRPKVRQEALRTVDALEAAWRLADHDEKRFIIHHLAESVAIAAGQHPRPNWRDAEALVKPPEE
jgi:site-specific DNA recombinase